MERRDRSLGILLVLLGLIFLLYNLKLIGGSLAFLIFSLGLILVYFQNGKLVYLISGLIVMTLALINLLDTYAFPNLHIKGFLFLTIFAIIGFILFLRLKNRLYLIASLILGSFGIYYLIREVSMDSVVWVLFLMFALSSLIYYLVGYRELNITWPRNLALVFLILALIIFIVSKTRSGLSLGRLTSYIVALALMALGLRILYTRPRN